MLALLLLAAEAAKPAPAGPVDHLHQVVVEAIRNCPQGADGAIVVCARDRGIAEGWRLPKLDPRYAGNALRPSGRGTLATSDVAATGVGSCSATGAAGATGCSLAEANAWGAWKREQKADGKPFPW